ncbi:MAG: formate C-acetyltransferase/glycerol dehydratase family glycyl radical enzyme [Planctomycetaceae bacterium]|nr:formate C-acetyltransferase/glycerol dehydratase family glycyl radical enzyme [Planctomycetaceae bacterium]
MTRFSEITELGQSARVRRLKDRMLAEPRYMSIEQALIVTEVYRNNPDLSPARKRAMALAEAMRRIDIAIDPEELLVGNRTAGVRAGVVFPEAGISWIDRELETLPTRPQDKFNVRPEDSVRFREEILPFWKGKSLEDTIRAEAGDLVDAIGRVVKINQKDHAQGHICPDVAGWLEKGPAGLRKEIAARRTGAGARQNEFYDGADMVLAATGDFMRRYAELAEEMVGRDGENAGTLREVARICRALPDRPPETFHEALQSLWFLFTLLHLESNASSFSPGRADQYLYPFFKRDMENGRIDLAGALELIECLWLKFNQIVYLRNSHSASFFAGFPIGFNVALGGIDRDGNDATNDLSFLFLKAQSHILLPQPNLSARLHAGSPEELLNECSRVVGMGSGMPQFFNDESIVPALMNQVIEPGDARDYAIVGCVELTTAGNNLGWSDAAMFNLPKALELAMNDGKCLITGAQLGPHTGTLPDFATYEELENAFAAQIDYFFDKMITACEKVEEIHQRVLPSAFLSTVINDCLDKGLDVTRGGAHYNLSGIQAIQVANVADSLAAVKHLVYDEQRVGQADLLQALRNDFAGREDLALLLLNKAPKFGNDVQWVDDIGQKWIAYFAGKFAGLKNYRGGPYHTGLYTVSAHVPMGANVGASPDGRRAGTPLADGGMSAVYGRDTNGPTALLRSVSRIDAKLGSNGTLLNMKFLPQFFKTEEGIAKFSSLLRAFVHLRINHVQFNVVNREDLLAAQKNPDNFPHLTIRVAGYTAYFTELSKELQDEIIARTTFDNVG